MKITKYIKKRGTGIDSNTRGALERIAMKASFALEERGGIEVRNNDTEDFLDVSVQAIQKMLEDAYRLGKEDGEKTCNNHLKFLRPDTEILTGNEPEDYNDPDSAGQAIELAVPTGFNRKAKAMMDYLDGCGFIFAYKGKLVLTDESLELTEYCEGSACGGPRMVCDTWDELEKMLEESYDELMAEGLI